VSDKLIYQRSSIIKRSIQATLNLLGYEIRPTPKREADSRIPIELSEQDRELVHHVMANQLTMVSYERLSSTILASHYVVQNDIAGDFVECGVWRGGNALVAASVFRRYGSDKKVWLFDTFAGMTAPTDHDFQYSDGKLAAPQYHASLKKEHNEWALAHLGEVTKTFRDFSLSDRAIFVRGDVNDTLRDVNQVLPPSISILRLDTDWYESTMTELGVLYPRLSVGGCLIVDDYGHWAGSRKATDEYFTKMGNRPFLQSTDYSGRAGVKLR